MFIAEGLIKEKYETSRMFPMVLINVYACDINLSDRTILSAVARIKIAASYVICNNFGKEIRDNVRKFLKKDEPQGDVLKNNAVSKPKYKDMKIKERTCSLQVRIKEYLNDKNYNDTCLQNIEEEASFKNNVESKQHHKYYKELLRLHSEISKYQETMLKYKVI